MFCHYQGLQQQLALACVSLVYTRELLLSNNIDIGGRTGEDALGNLN